jgi:hypothetical protein
MNLPRQYSYNPRSWLIVLLFGAGIAWIAVNGFLYGHRPFGIISLMFSFGPIMLGSLLAVRRVAFQRYLVLDKEALLLPTGFLRLRVTRIPYFSIERVWQTRLPFGAVLSIATKDGKFDVVSAMLPDADSYVDIGKFLQSLVDSTA